MVVTNHNPAPYTTLAKLRLQPGVPASGNDELLRDFIAEASRAVDDFCGRRFYTTIETRTLDGDPVLSLLPADLLSATTIAGDEDGDETWGETWTEGTHVEFVPRDLAVKWGMEEIKGGALSMPKVKNYFQIAGVWGYGDGLQADPWALVVPAVAVTLANDSTTAATVDVQDKIEVGQVIRVETEDLYVTEVDGSDLTVIRAVNGTTAATHAGLAAYVPMVPRAVVRAATWVAGDAWAAGQRVGLFNFRIGDYSGQILSTDQRAGFIRAILGRYTRPVA